MPGRNGPLVPGAPNGTAGAADATFTASGGGTIANRTATATFTDGVIVVDAEGRVSGVTGKFTFGAGGELPGGQPVSYTVTLTAPVPASAAR